MTFDHDAAAARADRVLRLIQPIVNAEIDAGRDGAAFAAQAIASLAVGIQSMHGTDTALAVLSTVRAGLLSKSKAPHVVKMGAKQ